MGRRYDQLDLDDRIGATGPARNQNAVIGSNRSLPYTIGH